MYDLELDRVKLKSRVEALKQASEQAQSQSSNASSGGDISWIDHKLVGTWLLLWPCMWSITLAAPPGHLPDFKMLALFGCGALLLRGAKSKCTVNDLFDRDIDTKVERTKLGPFEGLCFLGFQWLLGLGILLQLNNYWLVLILSTKIYAQGFIICVKLGLLNL